MYYNKIITVTDTSLKKILNKFNIALQGPRVEFVACDDGEIKLCVFTEYPYGLKKTFEGYSIVWERPSESEM